MLTEDFIGKCPVHGVSTFTTYHLRKSGRVASVTICSQCREDIQKGLDKLKQDRLKQQGQQTKDKGKKKK